MFDASDSNLEDEILSDASPRLDLKVRLSLNNTQFEEFVEKLCRLQFLRQAVQNDHRWFISVQRDADKKPDSLRICFEDKSNLLETRKKPLLAFVDFSAPARLPYFHGSDKARTRPNRKQLVHRRCPTQPG